MLLAVAVPVAVPRPLPAQTGSAYIPMDHWTMPYIEHLVRAGVLQDPAPLTRPLRRHAVARALAVPDTAGIGTRGLEILRFLQTEFVDDTTRTRYQVEFFAEGSAITHARRDPLRPAGEGGPHTRGGAHGWAVAGPLSLSHRTMWDTRLRDDPEYKGRKNLRIPGRIAEAYVSIETGPADIVFGNLDRNWGSPSQTGLLISNFPYSYDHLYAAFDTKYFGLQSLVSQLDEVPDSLGITNQRYWVAHRAVFRPLRTVTLWIGQATLLSGASRQLDFWALNPLRLGNFSAQDENSQFGTNSFVEGTIRIALPSFPIATATLLVDDIDVLNTSNLPERLATNASVEGGLGGRVTWGVYYTLVSNLAYRTFRFREHALRRNVGIAQNFSDFDQLTARTWVPAPLTSIVGVEVTLLRQGEGDIRTPFPASFQGVPFLFTGVVERTWRAAVSLDSHPIPNLFFSGALGLHVLQNSEHIPDVTATDVVGRVSVAYRFTVPIP